MIDHAHPTFITGHPFKGSWVMGNGYLLHPDMKRFAIMTPFLFAPPNPAKIAGFEASSNGVPTFQNFFSSYFGSKNYDFGDSSCGRMMRGMKQCYENNGTNPMEACQYYIDGFNRMTCANQAK